MAQGEVKFGCDGVIEVVTSHYFIEECIAIFINIYFSCLHHSHALVYICKIFGRKFLCLILNSGQWDMNNRKLYQSATIQSWGLLVYGKGFPANKIDRFEDCLRRTA